MTTDPTDIRAQADAEAAALELVKLNNEQFAKDLVWLMSDERGRSFVWRILEASGVYRLSYQHGDPHGTAFREGGRNIGLAMLSLLHEHCHLMYAVMVDEAQL